MKREFVPARLICRKCDAVWSAQHGTNEPCSKCAAPGPHAVVSPEHWQLVMDFERVEETS